MNRFRKAWIGDALFALYGREWCCQHNKPGKLFEVMSSNRNLEAYSRSVLMEPQWDGTAFEAYLYDINSTYGSDAAKALVVNVCEWSMHRMQRSGHRATLP